MASPDPAQDPQAVITARKKAKNAVRFGMVDEAIEHLTEAVDLGDPSIVTRCHRSGMYLKKQMWDEALADAEYILENVPTEIMGFIRKAAALMGKEKYEEAMMAYLKAFDIDPKDKMVLEGMKECKTKLTGAPTESPLISPFNDKELWNKIFKNEMTREYMRDPEYRDKVTEIQKDAKKLKEYVSDPRIMMTLGVLLDVDMNDPAAAEAEAAKLRDVTDKDDVKPEPPQPMFDLTDLEAPQPEPEEIVTDDPWNQNEADEIARGVVIEEIDDDDDDTMPIVAEPEPMDTSEPVPVATKPPAPAAPEAPKPTTPEKPAAKPARPKIIVSKEAESKALKEKELGNEAYKKKDLETALGHYNKAVELDPNNIVFRNNRAAVYFEQQKYDECIKECEDGVDIGRENRADFKLIAKALARAGNAYYKKGDYESTVKFYQKSLSEFRDPQLVKKLQSVQKELEEKRRLEYINPELSLEEKTKGNQHFQKGDYPTAIKYYTEAIRRNPEDAKIFSNRAACYTKLAEFNMALKDCDECIKLDPKFIKGYLRKGGTLLALKQTTKAGEAYQKALELDPKCQEAIDGYRKCSVMDNDPEAVRARAMQDPEVQQILADPAMQLILQQMQKDPKALQEHLKNPEVAKKIEKLLEVGLIGIR